MLNSGIQQGFSPWSKVNWMENFWKCRPVMSLEPCQRSVIEVFCENRWLLFAVLFLVSQRLSAHMFHGGPNVPL